MQVSGRARRCEKGAYKMSVARVYEQASVGMRAHSGKHSLGTRKSVGVNVELRHVLWATRWMDAWVVSRHSDEAVGEGTADGGGRGDKRPLPRVQKGAVRWRERRGEYTYQHTKPTLRWWSPTPLCRCSQRRRSWQAR